MTTDDAMRRPTEPNSKERLDQIERCRPLVRSIIKKAGILVDDREDVQQESELAASRGDWHPSEGAFEAWIAEITENKCKDYWRKATAKKRLPQKARSAKPVSEVEGKAHVDPDRAELLREALIKELRSLDKTDAEILVLSYIDDLSAPEIAGIVGLTAVAVRQRLHRAKNKIKENDILRRFIEE